MNKKILYFLLIFLVSVCSCSKETAKSGADVSFEIDKEYKRGPIVFNIKVDKKEINIAERINLVINVRVKEDYEVRLPEFGEKLEQFGITDYSSPMPQLIEDKMTLYRKSYELEPFLSGEYKIPPMKVLFWKKEEVGAPEEGALSEEKRHEIESEEILITVKSLLPEDASEMRLYEIAPPVDLPGMDKKLFYILLLSCVLVCGGAVFFIWRKKRKKKDIIVVRPPHEIAYDDLERLIAEDLIEKGEVKAFYLRLSNVLRHYIENSFALKAPERTTEEFLHDLKDTNKLVPAHKQLLKEFLQHCDMVKFAEHAPTDDEIQQAFDACKKFISETVVSAKNA